MKNLICFLYFLQTISVVTGAFEVCSFETLKLSCDEDEVILMKTAKYGRMQPGRCLQGDYKIGCSVDVIGVLDSFCTGKRFCEMFVSNALLENKANACPSDVPSYLEYEYKCVKVATLTGESCSYSNTVRLLGSVGYMSNIADEKRGVSLCHYQIEASDGQRIQLSLIDFKKDLSPATDTCEGLAIVQEVSYGTPGRNHLICKGDQRRSAAYISSGKALSVRMMNTVPKSEDTLNFLLKYKIIGCADPELPKDATLQRYGDEAVITISCDTGTREKYRLTCVGTRWAGVLGNCYDTASN